MKHLLAAALVVWGAAVQAVELQLPLGAQPMATRDTGQDRYFAPVGPFAGGTLPTQMIEGAIARSAWRIEAVGLTPLQIIAPLRAQLEAAGYELVLDCAAAECGGYDFRFAAEVLPAPNMYVNIRNYHVVTGLRGHGAEAVNIIASASSGASFVQVIQAGGEAPEPVVATAAVATATVPVQGDELLRDGHLVLGGLEFESGTAELGAGPFEALAQLAQTLRGQPDLRIALVGHTDNIGSLEGNIALSQGRAQAVREQLIAQYGIDGARLEVHGIGYLSPLMANTTQEGREANRRVEAVVLAQ
jgi:outer membrane protein OmpA-like peptidoglycan-associated protein